MSILFKISEYLIAKFQKRKTGYLSIINKEGNHKFPWTIKIQNLTLIGMFNSATSLASFPNSIPITLCALS